MPAAARLESSLGQDETFATVELRISFFKPVWELRLTATAKVLRRTRKLAYVEADIKDERGGLVAKLSSSCLVLSGADAEGRRVDG
jgi:uncharacterized protein (TIGR00369 family)